MRQLLKIFFFALTISFSWFKAHSAELLPSKAIQNQINQWHEDRFRDVIRQSKDQSCGAAAMAMYLKLAYDRNVGEEEILDKVQYSGKPITALDLKNAASAYDVDVKVLKVNIDFLKQKSVKGVLLVQSNANLDINDGEKFYHYVYLSDFKRNTFTLLDPALGKREMSPSDLSEIWFKDKDDSERGIFLTVLE